MTLAPMVRIKPRVVIVSRAQTISPEMPRPSAATEPIATRKATKARALTMAAHVDGNDETSNLGRLHGLFFVARFGL
jgi:hypothetical protein